MGSYPKIIEKLNEKAKNSEVVHLANSTKEVVTTQLQFTSSPQIGTGENPGTAPTKNEVVLLSGDQTISGVKTFNSTITGTITSATNATTATTATKLGTATVGATNKPIYLNAGAATALSGNIGDANTPVYIADGVITSTGKSFASYLPLAGGTVTGNLTVNGNITGKLYSPATITYGANNFQYFNISTTTSSGANVVANPTSDWYYHIIMNHGNGNGYYFDIACCFHNNNIYYRRIASGVESGWIKIIDSGGGTINGPIKQNVVTLSSGTIDLSLGNAFAITLGDAVSFSITNPGANSCFSLMITNGGNYTVTWPSTVKWADGEKPELTASGTDCITFITMNSGSTWIGVPSAINAK